MKRSRIFIAAIIGILAWSPLLTIAQATDTTDLSTDAADATTGSLKQQIEALNAQVKDRQAHVKNLDASIQNYKAKITEQENAVNSLQNEVALLDNRVEEKQLAIERTRNEIDITNLEIQSLAGQISLAQSSIDRRLSGLSELIRQIQDRDEVNELDVFLNKPSLSEFFARVDQLKSVNNALVQATQSLKEDKDKLDALKKQDEEHRTTLLAEKDQLQKDEQTLEQDRQAKLSLIGNTQNEESEYQRILYELRQDQQQSADDIDALQSKLKDQIDAADAALAHGSVLFNWPVKVTRGLSAHFHDPSYPFRRMFEHPGTDIPTDVGTPVHAAAGGYVAWTKTGKQYGNYIMIIHPGGIATIYAHLIRFNVKADTYVERGDIIGYSGGRPGDPGAGLSTGPHLHFEVRKNGIPVNAEQYLPSLD